MVRCARRHSRTLCLQLACLSMTLHLVLVLLTLSMFQSSCQPSSHHVKVNHTVAYTNLTSLGDQHARNTRQEGSSVAGGYKAGATLNMDDIGTRENSARSEDSSIASNDMAGLLNRLATPGNPAGRLDLAKLQALFDHPLYNLPQPLPEEGDRLLRVKAKVKQAEQESMQQWQSGAQDGYDPVNWSSSPESHPPWLRFHLGITRWQLYTHRDPRLTPLMEQLSSHRIVSAVQKAGGTQLKLVMSFPNYGQALFKPMKQERDEETNVNLYYFSDFERHNAEIAAFHLDRILGFRRVPPVVGRLIDVIRDIKDVTTDHKLAKTFFTSPVGNACFYGQCTYYCSTEHAVCGRPRALEGSVAAMLPDLALAPRRSWRSPWRRSYSRSKLAAWEKDNKYCETLMKTPPYDKGTRLVDLIDMTILDFLMSNMDRHHYETFETFGNDTFLIHLDNGRAFGRHSKDEPSILAPLVQCCRIRSSTLLRLRLLLLPSFRLSDVVRASLSQDPLATVAPLLSESHLSALDRRLATVLKTVEDCLEKHQQHSDVIYDDITH